MIEDRERIARYFEACAAEEGITAQYWWSEAARRVRAFPSAEASAADMTKLWPEDIAARTTR